jgi:hypothetical protein
VLGNYPTPANASTVSYASGAAAITITATDTTNYGVQIRQGGLQIDSGVTYLVTFDAFASKAHDISPTLTTGDWKWQSNATVSLTTTKAPYSVELKSNINSPDGMLQFCVGKALATVTIDNVTMVRKGSTAVGPRSATSARLALRTTADGLAWSRSTPLESAATIRLLDAEGRELHRATVPAGTAAGLVPSVGSGLRFVVLEGASFREVQPVATTR